ncbi:hypothetical protein GUJ93_ZPchr0003g18255 [Zizania palustris]|uniref:Uncharacterized protein n=1 Tax=Zizania palustris TaxID=103762 RepID=A0A8J5SWN5_ZIZPA|nr:hypothetical protein GUJ93_ZPchr0003g18255 [Zizania palustris]
MIQQLAQQHGGFDMSLFQPLPPPQPPLPFVPPTPKRKKYMCLSEPELKPASSLSTAISLNSLSFLCLFRVVDSILNPSEYVRKAGAHALGSSNPPYSITHTNCLSASPNPQLLLLLRSLAIGMEA